MIKITSLQEKTLVHLYQELYELTNPLCKQCRAPQSCCSSEYCEMAKDIAKQWGKSIVELNEHPTLPYMSKTGCIVPPHLRPLCTKHQCSINSIGFLPNDEKTTARYFDLVEKINLLECEIYE